MRLRAAPLPAASASVAAQVPIAIWVVSNPALRGNRFHGSAALSYGMLCCAAGFFLHDAVCCLLRESPFYIVHGVRAP